MVQQADGVPGSGIDKAPDKSFADKLADTVTAIGRRSESTKIRAGRQSRKSCAADLRI